jgi:hypothetical protein
MSATVGISFLKTADRAREGLGESSVEQAAFETKWKASLDADQSLKADVATLNGSAPTKTPTSNAPSSSTHLCPVVGPSTIKLGEVFLSSLRAISGVRWIGHIQFRPSLCSSCDHRGISATRGARGSLGIGTDQWPFKFFIAALPEHVRAFHEHQLT